jgi:hypothetical protein
MIMFRLVLMVWLVCCIAPFSNANAADPPWKLSILPASVRMDPASHRLYDAPYDSPGATGRTIDPLLRNNWVYNGKYAAIKGARGEYVSFQLVITKDSAAPLKGIAVAMAPFKNRQGSIRHAPELFLEWAVEVKTPSTGYPQASLGRGWYPDALIPFSCIQQGTTAVKGGWTYPLQLPDFNNRIGEQRSALIWVDQYIPFQREEAAPGSYSTNISVTINGVTQSIPVELTVWDFALPNENSFKGSLQHEGFLSGMNEEEELEMYQLMKRNRVGIMDPTYKPELVKRGSDITINWKRFDSRLKKYLDGRAFTSAYGYDYGPGYGSPVETFLLPFDVYGKHGTRGWPDVGEASEERRNTNRLAYTKVIRNVREHLRPLVNPKKTDITVYLNGLDESYFPEAWARMAYYGELFKKEYPGTFFRVDGGYDDKAMEVIKDAISSWAVHTIEFDESRVRRYNAMGIKQWLYGPMIYESKINSWVGSSTFMDLPLVNDRAISWSVWKYKAHSWISWGAGAGWRSAWYDPETWKSANDGGNASGFDEKKLNGNGMMVYSPGIVPNVNTACPSIRLKMMRNGVQEFEYMKLLAIMDKNEDRVNAIVNRVINRPFGDSSIGNLAVWSYDPGQWDRSRDELGELINASTLNSR